ncbi:MAG: AraC family transcriptional regulator [Sphingobacteriia bacterium 28-36-52]|nr:MAG: AraC family transcriptional regulator [Sphingobacteriia bacterium 28-36-52]
MVCGRCKLIVKAELEKLGFSLKSIELGEVEIDESIDTDQKKVIAATLSSFGFELINDKKSKTIEQIKNLIRDLVHSKNNELEINLSEYISQHLAIDYTSLSNLFSEVEGTTIEKYFILQKIERVKELLMYDELSLSEIAFLLNYSSVAYLSNQFKKITGLTPSHFKQLKNKKRKHLDDL